MSIKFSRRSLFLATASFGLMGVLNGRKIVDKWGPRKFKGSVIGANFGRGHRLLSKNFPKPSRELKCEVAIAGSGISGLSAAYHLQKNSISDVHVFELENQTGGNSQSFRSLAPWGAHYLPLVNTDNVSLLDFLKEINVIESFNQEGIPKYNEFMVCSDPMDKLFIHGRLQDGLVPHTTISTEEKNKIDLFMTLMQAFSHEKGSDGLFAFNIPMENSSLDPKYLKLDEITMLEFLKQKNLNCEALNWYVNYCCRDDYGTEISEISAWAGIHYFAARRGKGVDLEDNSVLTWPEGNHFLAENLKKHSRANYHTAHMLFKVEGQSLFFYDFEKNETVKVIAKEVVLALPQFILARIFEGETSFVYSPWVVANLRVKWDQEIDQSLAWDNVNYHGKGLGFVLSNHQKLSTVEHENILTYYWPLTHTNPKDARAFALKRTHESWCKDIISDLKPVIFDIEQRIQEINIWPWGHAMVMPKKGFFTKERFQILKINNSHIHIAHTDLGGLSLFEEGFYRGEMAAQKISNNLLG